MSYFFFPYFVNSTILIEWKTDSTGKLVPDIKVIFDTYNIIRHVCIYFISYIFKMQIMLLLSGILFIHIISFFLTSNTM